MMGVRRVVGAVLVGGALLAGCGAGSSSASARCVDAGKAPAIIGTRLDSGLTLTGRTAAVKSSEFAKVYMVAVEFTGGPELTEVGVWMTNSLDGNGSVYSVDGFADQFSSWIAASSTDAAADITTDGASEAKACVLG